MKSVLVVIIVILLCSCAVGSQSAYNYPNAVVVDKSTMRSSKLQLRIKEANKYTLKWIEVPRGEFINFELGDTIKILK